MPVLVGHRERGQPVLSRHHANDHVGPRADFTVGNPTELAIGRVLGKVDCVLFSEVLETLTTLAARAVS